MPVHQTKSSHHCWEIQDLALSPAKGYHTDFVYTNTLASSKYHGAQACLVTIVRMVDLSAQSGAMPIPVTKPGKGIQLLHTKPVQTSLFS